MCCEETEETVIHEDISQWGTAEGKTDTFCLWADSIWRDLNTRHLLGEIYREIYITQKQKNKQSKDIWQKMQHEYLNVYEYA